MKYLFMTILFLMVSQLVFSQPHSTYATRDVVLDEGFSTKLQRWNKHIYLSKNTLTIYDEEYSTEQEQYTIIWEIINKINYISFNYTGKTLGPNVQNGNKRYLIIFDILFEDTMSNIPSYYSEFIGFYDHNNKLVFHMSTLYYTFSEFDDNYMSEFCKMETSTELRENQIVYSVDNLMKLEHLFPWVEGLPGNGEGVKIVQTYVRGWRHTSGNIMLINGFIDYNRPYLFEQNNRVRGIKITCGNKEMYWDFNDDALFQHYWINYFDSEEVSFEIIDVYPGTKYNDTCINYLIFFNANPQ